MHKLLSAYQWYFLLCFLAEVVFWVQAERWGSNLIVEDVESVDLSQRPFVVRGTDTEVSYGLCSR